MLDLDALERVVREMTPGEWELMGDEIVTYAVPASSSHPFWIVSAAQHFIEEKDGESIVALRNAAESLIGELRAAREVVEATKADRHLRRLDPGPERWSEVETLSCAVDNALAAYQTAMGEER